MDAGDKNILIVAHYYPPHVGGLEIVAEEQARSFACAGKNVSVVTSAFPGVRAETKIEGGIAIHRVAALNFFDARFGIPFPLGGIGLVRTLHREVKKADIIYLHDVFYETSWITYLLARFHGKPIVLTQHVGMVAHPNLFVTFLEHAVYATWGKLIFNYSNAIIVYNSNVKAFLIGRKVDSANIFELRNGIDLKTFHPAMPEEKKALRKHFGFSAEKPLVLFVGRLVPKKGFKELLEAHDDDYDLVLAGSGETEPRWSKVPGIHLMGAVSRDELAALYRASDLFVLPAKGELFTLAMQEAMASGLPVITTDDPGYRDYDVKRDLIAFTEPTPSELKRAIRKVLADASLREKMSAYSLDLARRWFDWEVNIKAVMELVPRDEQENDLSEDNLAAAVKRPKRLTVVAPYFYPKIGGVENYAYNIARRLHAKGDYHVSIVTSDHDGQGYERGTLDGMTVHRLPVSWTVSNTPIDLSWYSHMKKIFAEEQTDIIHAHSPVVFMADVAAAAANKMPIVLTYHSGSMRKGAWPIDGLISLYEKTFLRSLFRRANVIVSYYEKFVEKELAEFSNKVRIIPPGVDGRQFRQTPLPVATETVTFVGRIEQSSSWKGIEQLLQAMALVIKKRPQATLELVGSGDAVEHYRMRARELGIALSVTFAGSKMGKDLASVYERSSVVVLPSTSDAESFGIVLIEAMASGRPVIGSNIGGIPRVIDHGKNGLLVPPRDPQALAEAIAMVLSDRSLARRFADAGVLKARQFDWDVQTKKYEEIFTSLA